jgi:hypothetical protein
MKTQYSLVFRTLALLLLLNFFTGGYACRQLCTAWSMPAFEQLQSRFAESAGRLWFECEDFAAEISYGLSFRFAALRDKLSRGARLPQVDQHTTDAPALTHLSETDA